MSGADSSQVHLSREQQGYFSKLQVATTDESDEGAKNLLSSVSMKFQDPKLEARVR